MISVQYQEHIRTEGPRSVKLLLRLCDNSKGIQDYLIWNTTNSVKTSLTTLANLKALSIIISRLLLYITKANPPAT